MGFPTSTTMYEDRKACKECLNSSAPCPKHGCWRSVQVVGHGKHRGKSRKGQEGLGAQVQGLFPSAPSSPTHKGALSRVPGRCTMVLPHHTAEAGLDETWGQAVHTDVPRAQLHCQVLGEAQQGCFTHIVRAQALGRGGNGSVSSLQYFLGSFSF